MELLKYLQEICKSKKAIKEYDYDNERESAWYKLTITDEIMLDLFYDDGTLSGYYKSHTKEGRPFSSTTVQDFNSKMMFELIVFHKMLIVEKI